MSDINKIKSVTPMSAKYLQALVENLSEFILLVDAEGLIKYVSPSFQRTLGYAIKETIGKSAFTFVHPEDLSKTRDEYAQLKIHPELVQDVTLRLIHKDGSVRYVNGKRKNLLNDPEIEGIILNVHDVTESIKAEALKKEKEEELQRKESLLSSVEKLTKIGGWEYNLQTKETYYTDEIFNIYGIAKDKMFIPNEGIKFYHPDDRSLVFDSFTKAINNGEPYDLEVRFINANGENLWVRTSGIPVFQNGKIVKVVGNLMNITERKLTEQALYESELKFRLLFENMVEGFSLNEIITDENGNPVDFRILNANAAYERHTGLKTNEIIGKTIREIMPQSDSAQIVKYGNVALTGNPITFEYYSKPFDRHFHVVVFSPQPGLFATIFEDITERQKAEIKIRAINEKLRLAQSASKAGSWDWDIVNNIFYWSEEFLDLFGLDQDTNPGFEVWTKRLHPEDVELASKRIKDSIENKTELINDYRIILPSKEIRWIRSTGKTLYESGKPTRMTGLCFDITERMLAEEELKKSEERYRLLFNSMPVGAGLADLEGNILDANPAMLNIIGYTLEEIRSEKVTSMYLNLEDHKQLHNTLKSEGRISDSELKLKRKDNSVFDGLLNIDLIEREGKQFLLTTLRDITAQKQFEEELKHYTELELRKNEELAEKNADLKKARIATLNIIDDLSHEIEERKHTEELLKAGELKFRTVADFTYDWEYWEDENRQIVYMSPSCLRITGYTPEEFIANPKLLTSILHNEDVEELHRHHDVVYSSEHRDEIDESEFRIVSKFGTIVNISHVCRPIFDENKNFLGRRISNRDITERKHSENALLMSEEKFRKAFMISPDSININRLSDGVYVSVNLGFTKIMGYTETDVLGKSSLEINVWENNEDRNKLVEGLQSKGYVQNLEGRFRAKDGSIRYGLMSASVIDLNGIPHILSITRDITDRKKIEEALKASEIQHKEMIANISDVIAIISIDGIIKYKSPNIEKWFGWKPEDLEGVDAWITVHPEDLERIQAEFFNLLDEDNSMTTVEYRYKCKDGSYKWIELTAINLRNDSTINGVLTNYHDITERKKDEKRLRESENKMRLIVEGTPYLFFYTQDKDARITYVSPSVENITGRTAEEWYAQSHWFVTDSEINEIARKKTSAHLKGEYSVGSILVEIEHADKHPILLEIYESPIFENGVVVGLQGVAHDITERKRAEEALKNSETRMRTLIQTIPDLIWLKDMNGVYLLCNSIFERLYGAKEADIIGKTDYDFVDKELADFFRENDKKAMAEGKPTSNEETVIFADDGHEAFLDTLKTPMYNADGSLVGILGLGRDMTERKLSEEKLRESEKEYRGLFELANDSIIIFEPENEIVLEVNSKACETYGFSREEFIGKSLKSISHDVESGEKRIEAMLEDITLNNFETIHFRKDGTPLNMLVSASVIKYKGKKAIQSINLDISDRINSEEKIRESENKFRTLITQMQLGLAVHEIICNENGVPIDYRFIDVNPSFEKLTGLKREIVLGKTVLELMPNTELEWIEKYGHVALTGEPLEYENYSIELERYYGVIAYRTRPNEFAVIIEDITERKLAEEELKKRNSFIQTVLDNLPMGVALNEVDTGKTIYVNKKFEEAYGWPKEEMQDVPSFFQKVYPDKKYREELISRVLGDIQSGDVSRMHWEDCIVTHKDGSRHVVDAVNIPMFEQNTMVSTVIDNTERKRAEQELSVYRNHLEDLVTARTNELDKVNEFLRIEIEKAKEYEVMLQNSLDKEKELNEIKTRFISTTSHEFRTPLTSVLSSAELLQRYSKKWSEDKLNVHFNRIKGSVQYLVSLLDDVLTISRAERGKIALHPEKVNLKMLANEYIEDARTLIKNHELHFNYKTKKTEFLLDPKLLKFIVGNLLSNSIKYSPNGGKIELNITTDRKNLIIEVSDEGIGIPAAEIGYIFQSFYRTKNAEEIAGTGLGLSIVKLAVDLHSGEISVKSEINKGSSFVVKIPK